MKYNFKDIALCQDKSSCLGLWALTWETKAYPMLGAPDPMSFTLFFLKGEKGTFIKEKGNTRKREDEPEIK